MSIPWHKVARQLMLTRGVIPTVVEAKSPGVDPPSAAKECIMETVEYARGLGLCGTGDKVVAMYNVERQCAVVRVIEVDADKNE